MGVGVEKIDYQKVPDKLREERKQKIWFSPS